MKSLLPAIFLSLLFLFLSFASRGCTVASAQEPIGRDHEHGVMTDSTRVSKEVERLVSMPSFYGSYFIGRESSGTSWQPDSSPLGGIRRQKGRWLYTFDGFASLAWKHESGPRGDEEVFSTNFLMATAGRPAGRGRIGIRTMMSLEPYTIGGEGYPLLLQTGGTADGRTLLIDRQYPQDLLMELALTGQVSTGGRSTFLYVAPVGEPALGPPAFMHRPSAAPYLEAPIGHHWFDATHTSYGVTTLGAVRGEVKLEVSAFGGREPDEDHDDIETPRLDSYSFRVSLNPSWNWALQASYGHLRSPEAFRPDVNVRRTTVSAAFNRQYQNLHAAALFGWARNEDLPGSQKDALLFEGVLTMNRYHTFFARIERVQKELLPETSDVQNVERGVAGYRYDLFPSRHATVGIGAAASLAVVPSSLDDAYGDVPHGGMVFVMARLR